MLERPSARSGERLRHTPCWPACDHLESVQRSCQVIVTQELYLLLNAYQFFEVVAHLFLKEAAIHYI